MPMPRAALTMLESTSDRPTTAFRKMGNVAKNVTTITAGSTPNPKGMMRMPTRAKEGIVSPTVDTLLASAARRGC